MAAPMELREALPAALTVVALVVVPLVCLSKDLSLHKAAIKGKSKCLLFSLSKAISKAFAAASAVVEFVILEVLAALLLFALELTFVLLFWRLAATEACS